MQVKSTVKMNFPRIEAADTGSSDCPGNDSGSPAHRGGAGAGDAI